MEDRNPSAARQPEAAVADAFAVEKAARLTYEDVFAFAQLKGAGDMTGGARNRASSLSSFLASRGLAVESNVGHELASGFDDAVTAYLKTRRADGLKESSLANQRTHLKWWAATLSELVELRSQPRFATFREAFDFYFEVAKKKSPTLSLSGLSRLCGKSSGYFSHLQYQIGKTVFLTSEIVQKLEDALGAPPTAFSRFTAATHESLTERASHANMTVYGKLIRDLTSDPYLLTELPPQLVKEVRDFIRFKTTVSPALKRNMRWTTRPNSSCTKKKWLGIISADGKNYSPTASKFLGHVKRYFGALARLGHDPAEFSLVWLCEPDLISEYLEFAKNRVGNITKGHLPVLLEGQSMLYAEGGWICQQPTFGARLRDKVCLDQKGWLGWCATRRAALIEQLKNIKKDGLVKRGRSVQEPIKEILDRDHPLDAIFELIESMEIYLKKFEWNSTSLDLIDKAVFERDITVLKIITLQPLRARMFEEMTYRTDNTGNLYKRASGEWAIRFKPEDFKNVQGAAKDQIYDVSLPMGLTASITHYVEEVRPKFRGAGDRMFMPSAKGGPKGSKGTRSHAKNGTEWLTRGITRRSKQFLSGCPGFGTHALRHIVATDYIKNNPGDYLTAAQILHDKLETVMKEYAHLKAEDGHRRYQLYHGKLMESWRQRA